jgi:hypothetical protein
MFVSTKTMENVPELIEKLIDLASKHSFLKKQIPKAYYDLHEAVIKLRPSPVEPASSGSSNSHVKPAGPSSSGSLNSMSSSRCDADTVRGIRCSRAYVD